MHCAVLSVLGNGSLRPCGVKIYLLADSSTLISLNSDIIVTPSQNHNAGQQQKRLGHGQDCPGHSGILGSYVHNRYVYLQQERLGQDTINVRIQDMNYISTSIEQNMNYIFYIY